MKLKIYLWYLAEFLLRTKNVSDKSFRRGRGAHISSLEQNTRFIFRTKNHPQLYILCSINFSPKVVPFVTQRGKIRTVGENTDDDIARRTHFACWVTKLQTHTHSEYVILLAFPQQQRFRKCASILQLYINCLSCLTINHTMDSFWATFSL